MPNHIGHDLAAEADRDRITAEVQIECELRVPAEMEREELADLLLGELRADDDVGVEYSMCSVDLNPEGWEYVPPEEPPEDSPDDDRERAEEHRE